MKKSIISYLSIILFMVFGMAQSIAQPLPCPPSNTTSITAQNTGAACSGACTQVFSNHISTLKSTSSYAFSNIPYLPTSYTGGTPILVGVDDIYSGVLNLPFDFCFYGTKYNQCIIGANGQICFDISHASGACPYPVTGPIPALANAATLNCIMGAYYDLDPSLGGTITYATYGTAPCRTFVVSWANIPLFSASTCPGLIGTQQVVLYESTYAIDIFIENEPQCGGWPIGNEGAGIIGIMDATGANWNAAPGYNGVPYSVSNTGFRFTPNATANWTFTWTDPAGTVIGTTDFTTVCPTVATTYTVRGVASSNCDSIVVYDSTRVLVGPSPIITGTTFSQPSYCGATDGRITVFGLVPGLTDTLFYTFNGTAQPPIVATSSPAGALIIPNLSAGSYTNIYVKVGPCTSNSVNVTLPQPPPPLVTVDSALVKTCIGNPVQLHTYATPFPIGYTYDYSWSGGTDLSSTVIANPVVNASAAGNVTYTITVNPSPAVPECASTETVTVHAIGDFTIVKPIDTICLLNPLVPVNVNVIGSSEIKYAWTPTTGVVTATSMSPVITPTAQGTYVYTVTGSYARCVDYTHVLTIIVDSPGKRFAVKDTICLGMSDLADFTVPGGDVYHYQWSSVPTGVLFSNDTMPNPTFTPTAIGAFTLLTYVKSPHEAAGCNVVDTVNLLVLPNVVTVSPVDTAICLGQVVQVTGTLAYGTLFNYQWLPTSGIPTSTTLNTLITPDTSAFYTLTASFHRCPDIHATLNLDVQPNPSVFLGGSRAVCQFDTLHLTAVISPAWYTHYTYSWSPATDLDNTTSSTVVFHGNTSTNLVLSVTTPAGCAAADSANITVLPGNFATIDINSDFCPHQSKTVVVTAAAGTSYHWSPAMYVSDTASGAPLITPITTQTYTIVATSADGCRDTVYWTATVYPDALVELGDSVRLYPGENYQMTPVTNGSSFVWFPTGGLSSPYISNPVATPDVSTNYIVTATTEHNCVASDTISIIVDDQSILGMPNAFVPGTTGNNTTFKVAIRGIATLNYFRVYNRWGNLMFETKYLSEGWDGTYKGEPQDMGVYIYDVQAKTSTGKIVQKTGNVTLLR